MIIYFVLYGAIGASTFLINRIIHNDKYKKLILCLFWLILLVFLFALRHPSMGVDLQYGFSTGYIGNFERIANIQFSDLINRGINHYEIGYVIYNKLLSYVSTNTQFFLGACAFSALVPIIYMIFKYSDSPLFSLIIYLGLPCFIMLFSGMRQIIAIGLCALSLNFIFKKRIFWFIIIVLLATLFHSSAIVFLIAYPIYFIKINKTGRLFSLVLIALVFIFRFQLFTILSKLLKDNAEIDNNGAINLFLVFIVIYVYCFFCGKIDEKTNGLLNLFLLGCICQAFGGVNSIALRVGYYFIISLIFLIPKVVKNIRDNQTRLVSTIGISFAFIVFGLISLYVTSWAMSYPYYFYWMKM